MTPVSFQTTFVPLNFPFREIAKREVPEIEVKIAEIKKNAKEFLQNEVQIEPFFNAHVSEIFDFRIAALRWLVDNHAKMDDLIELLESPLANLQSRPGCEILLDNIEFAVRTNVRSIRQLLKNTDGANFPQHGFDFSKMEKPPFLNYETYLTTISQSVPEPVLELMIDWVNASLAIEFAICAALVLANENIAVSAQKINELSVFVANAGQEFGAITMEMKKIGQKPKQQTIDSSIENLDFLNQHQLADQGLLEYSAKLEPYEFN